MIKKIIHTFLHNPMPEQVQQQFRTWCLNKERAGEKTDALWKEWERLDPASVLPADEKAYRRKLDRLHREMTPPAAPKNLSADGKAHLVMLSWETVYSDNLMYYLVYRFAKGQAVDLNDPSAIVAKVLYDHDARKVYLDQEVAAGEYTYVVTALSRNNVESTPVETTVKVSKTKVKTINKKE